MGMTASSSDSGGPDEQVVADGAPHRTVSRRSVVAFLIAAPVLTVGANAVSGRVAPAAAALGGIPTVDVTDVFDMGDAQVLASSPTMPLVSLTVGTDNRIHLALPRLEMGQGLSTVAAMLLADEFDVPVDQIAVTLEEGRPDLMFNQFSGGSAGVRTFHEAMPLLATAARARLLVAAANRWGVDVASLTTSGGRVEGAGHSASYGELSEAAANVTDVSGVEPGKAQPAQPVVGTWQRRIDARDIVTGKKQFTMDLDVPGAKPTLVKRPPTINGGVKSVRNADTIRTMSGVIDVVPIPESVNSEVPNPPGVAVMAETFEQARAAVNALEVEWSDGPIAGETDESILAFLRKRLPPPLVPPLGALTVQGDFSWAAASHAPLESECAIVDVRDDEVEIWGPLQAPIPVKAMMARELGVPESKVKVNVVPGGGAFGRKVFWDAVQQAAVVSKKVKRPCKLMYHRTDDMRHTRLRPPQVHRASATLLLGQVLSYQHDVSAVSLDVRMGLGEMLTATVAQLPPVAQHAVGNDAIELAGFKLMVTSPYQFGVTNKMIYPIDIGMRTATYRSVHIHPTRGVEEVMVDEIAGRMGKDPVDFRLSFLRHARARKVLTEVARKGQWGRTLPEGVAQGVGVHVEARSFSAALVELDCRDRRNPLVRRATIAIDVGRPINLSGIEAQIEGGLVESISLVLRAGLHISNGLPLEGSYSQYHFARMKDYPKEVEIIHLHDTSEKPGGLGEVGMSAPAGAIANAFARATGEEARNFPLVHPVDFTPVPPTMLPDPPLR